MVDKYRNELSCNDSMIESTRKVKRGDQEYTVNTSKIGSNSKSDFDEAVDDVMDRHKGSLDKLAQSDLEMGQMTGEEIKRKGIKRRYCKNALHTLKTVFENPS